MCIVLHACDIANAANQIIYVLNGPKDVLENFEIRVMLKKNYLVKKINYYFQEITHWKNHKLDGLILL